MNLRAKLSLYPMARVVSPPIGGVHKLQFVWFDCEGPGKHGRDLVLVSFVSPVFYTFSAI